MGSKTRLAMFFLVVGLIMSLALPALAQDCGAPALQANVDKAAAILSQKGKAGLEEVAKIRFCKDEGYLYVTDMKGLMLMHPVQKHLEGKSVAGMKDPKGKLFYAEMMESVAKTGMAWSHYLWPKPGAKEPSEKCGYAKKATMDGQEVIVSSGLYDVKAQDCGKK